MASRFVGSDTLTHVLIVKDMLGDRAGCLRYLHLLLLETVPASCSVLALLHSR